VVRSEGDPMQLAARWFVRKSDASTRICQSRIFSRSANSFAARQGLLRYVAGLMLVVAFRGLMLA
jgi:hypothetical protein